VPTKCPAAHSSGQLVQIHTESEFNKSRKMGRTAKVIARNFIFDIDCDIANRADRPYEHRGDLNHGTAKEGAAPWAGTGTPMRMGFVNSAQPPPIRWQKTL